MTHAQASEGKGRNNTVNLKLKAIILFGALSACASAFSADTTAEKSLKQYFKGLPFDMPALEAPAFPANRVSITEFGAVADGRTINTDAIAKAMRACSDRGGGTVVIPPGTWLTGPIKLESNVNLHLERGALVQFSDRIEDFPLIAGFDGKSKRFIVTPLLWGYRLNNIAITGEGVFDGAGEVWRPVKKEKQTPAQWKELVSSGGALSSDGKIWWPSKDAAEGEQHLAKLESSGRQLTATDYAPLRRYLRPNMLQVVQCTGILLDGPTFRNSPRFHVYPQQSENIIIRNVSVKTEWHAQNGDGIDLGACRNAIVYNCTVDVGDDAICIKAGNPSKSQRQGAACENIVIADCIVFHGHGGFVVGSDTKGSARNIAVRNCIFAGTDVGLRFKSGRGHGGIIEDIFIDNIQMRSIVHEAILFDLFYENLSPDEAAEAGLVSAPAEPVTEGTPQFRDITIHNVVCSGAHRAMLFNGLPEMPVKGIALDNVSITAATGAMMINADSISLSHVSVMTPAGPVITLIQSSTISLRQFEYFSGAHPVLKVDGERSNNISVQGANLSQSKGDIVLGKSVNPKAVKIR